MQPEASANLHRIAILQILQDPVLSCVCCGPHHHHAVCSTPSASAMQACELACQVGTANPRAQLPMPALNCDACCNEGPAAVNWGPKAMAVQDQRAFRAQLPRPQELM